MAVQMGVLARNARLDSIETTLGTTPWLDLRTGAQPADCAQADSGTELEHMALPSDFLAAAASGAKAKNGTWSGTVDAAGTVAHFRLKPGADSSCEMQGSVTATSGGGDMEIDNVVLAIGQTVTVNTFTLTDGNA